MKAILILFASICATAADAATQATRIDAPGDIVLFALGVSGLLIGRRLHRRRKRRDG